MIIPATGMPSSVAISLSWLVAWSFFPIKVRSNESQYWNATSASVTPMIIRYWLSR